MQYHLINKIWITFAAFAFNRQIYMFVNALRKINIAFIFLMYNYEVCKESFGPLCKKYEIISGMHKFVFKVNIKKNYFEYNAFVTSKV